MLVRILREMFFGPGRRRKAEAVAAPGENPLASWLSNHNGRYVSKWNHYLDIYHRHFARFRGRSPVVLEVGVFHGGSLKMWHDYFGPGCRLYAVDNDPRCKAFEDEKTKVLIGDQADRGFLAQLRKEVPRADILVDDGGHFMNQQITTFEELFQHVADDGVYLCEDLHTSYWEDFGGGYRKPGSFIEFSKALIDQLNAWHSREPDQFQLNDFTRTTYCMHYYDSVLVIEKRPMSRPRKIVAGQPSF
jgi:hypothetical protein